MQPIIRKTFEKLISELTIKRSVLEIGATPDTTLLTLPAFKDVPIKIGVDLSEFDTKNSHGIEYHCKTDAHHLPFMCDTFNLVLCNSVLEHDPKFWLTLSEMKRVLDFGGTLIVGAPAFDSSRRVLGVHRYPKDFYRFGTDAASIWMEDLTDIGSIVVMEPPRLIAWGIKPHLVI